MPYKVISLSNNVAGKMLIKSRSKLPSAMG